jgi:hypothetical protein
MSTTKLLPFKRVQREFDDEDTATLPPLKRSVSEDLRQKKTEPVLKIHLGKSVYLAAQEFNGIMLIHLRVYETSQSGAIFPTKLGIALDLEKWQKLVELCLTDIDEGIEDMKIGKEVFYEKHLGENVFLRLDSKYPCVNIRKFFLPENLKEIRPTRKGCALNWNQWEELKKAVPIVQKTFQKELAEVEFCEMSADHQNQMGFYSCKRCNPNEWMNYV